MGKFNIHIGIDYAGEEKPNSQLPSLEVYAATDELPERIPPTTPEDENWTRQEIAEWLIEQARSNRRFIAGIAHGFSFPCDYFQRYEITSWDQFLEDFAHHWPTHKPHVSVDYIRTMGQLARSGRQTDFRITETWRTSPKSVFHFDRQKSSVARSTHAGLPWLLHIRREVGDLVHFWPFDGWQIANNKSVIAEVYPFIFRHRYPQERRTYDQHDAYSTARWLKETEERGFLERYLDPPLTDEERKIADLEGWILGIM